MIRYALHCAAGHGFEGWFPSSAAYDAQAEAKLLTCPDCGSDRVEKALMAPSVVTSRRKAKVPVAAAEPQSAPATPKPPEGPPAAAVAAALAAGMPPEMLTMMRRIREHVKENSDYVGPRFAEEARKIHYEESEARTIHGEASPRDVAELLEEGIEVHPLPVLPEDRN
jgi:hypothetical protein